MELFEVIRRDQILEELVQIRDLYAARPVPLDGGMGLVVEGVRASTSATQTRSLIRPSKS